MSYLMVSFALRALARRGASAAAAALAVSRPPAPSSTHGSGRAWAAAQTGWTRGFSSEGESTSGSAPDAEAKRPSLPPGLVKDDANTLNGGRFYLQPTLTAVPFAGDALGAVIPEIRVSVDAQSCSI